MLNQPSDHVTIVYVSYIIGEFKQVTKLAKRLVVCRICYTFVLESIKSSNILRLTRQPSFGNHGGQYDADSINIKKFQVMQQHIYYIKFALRFADMQIQELVTVFNHQVDNTGWSSMHAYHDQALIDEFQRRGIDAAAVYDGKAISFAHPVRYDIVGNRLMLNRCIISPHLKQLRHCSLLLQWRSCKIFAKVL